MVSKAKMRLKGSERFFHKVDADAQLDVTVLAQDVKGAVPNDPCMCGIARSINRANGQPEGACIIFKHTAWVLRPASAQIARKHPYVKRGELCFHHYRIDEHTRHEIRTFDGAGGMAGQAFSFLPMPAHATMAANRRRKRKPRKGGTQGPKGRIKTRVPFQRTLNFTFEHSD